MNSIVDKGLIILTLIVFASCADNNKEIFVLLRDQHTNDVIRGAREAGRTRDKIFVQELLHNAGDQRGSTNINFYGVTIYQSKMEALAQIFGESPPNKITYLVDSAIIKFYTELARQHGLLK